MGAGRQRLQLPVRAQGQRDGTGTEWDLLHRGETDH